METVKEIMDKYELSYHEAHKLTHVPHRTLQNWYLGYRQEPPYMAYLLESAIIRGEILIKKPNIVKEV